MTGFASAEAVVAPVRVLWEVRSVNHRFLDVSFRLPEELRPLEPRCRDVVTAGLRRGKVDCTLKLAPDGAGGDSQVNLDGLERLKRLAEQVRTLFPEARPLALGEILRWPGIVTGPLEDCSALEQPALDALAEAVASLRRARGREGERIAAMLGERCEAIVALLEEIRPRLDEVSERYRAKLGERLARLQMEADTERLEQELALIAQRADVAEEVDRLGSHVVEVRRALVQAGPIGRRLDFLVQELNREANTLASKVQGEALSRSAVEMKVLVEQMREQLQNLE